MNLIIKSIRFSTSTFTLTLLLFLILSLFNSFSQQPRWDWAKAYGSSIDDEKVIGMCIDDFGNIFITGYFESPTLTFGSITLSGSGWRNLFVTKLNNLGNVVWAKTILGATQGHEIKIDNENNIYVSGLFEGITYFDTDTLFSYGGWSGDVFIVKFDSTGKEIWVNQIGGIDNELVRCFDVNDNSIVLTGCFRSPILFFDSDSILNSGTNLNNDLFVLKLEKVSGNINYGKCFGGADWNDLAFSIAFDLYSNILITGVFRSPQINFDSITIYNSGGADFFLCKLNTQGTTQWVKRSYGNLNGYASGIKLNVDHQNNIYVLGNHSDSVLFIEGHEVYLSQNSYSDMFICKFNPYGSLQWIRNPIDGTQETIAFDIDTCGCSYLSGHYSEFSGFEFGNNVFITDTANGVDIFVVKYNSNGIAQWAINALSPMGVGTNNLCINNNNNIVISGETTGFIVFGYDTLYVSGNNQTDIFLAKLITPENLLDTQYIDLPQGWKIISGYIEPLEPDMDSVFSEISAVITIVKNSNGAVYFPLYNINAIGDFSNEEGYQVKAGLPQTLKLYGVPIEPEYMPISLSAGWQIVSYPRMSAAAISTMFTPISTKLILAKNSFGSVYWPAYGINYIGNMNPGEGYQIKMSQAAVLTYPAN